VTAATSRNKKLLTADVLVEQLNALLCGWANYFCPGPVSSAYRAIDKHALVRNDAN